MADYRIETLENRTRFAPGDVIEGVAGWETDSVKRATVRLFWRTEGKGTQDMGLAGEVEYEHPEATDARAFHFTAPLGPYSHAGRLVSIVWALELSVDKDGTTMDVEVRP